MNRRDEHREVSSGRASEETTRRFKGALRREVGDLEVRLEEAQLRSSALRHAGLDVEAAAVLEESRQMVDEFQRRLTTALAAAAVEREAERILASSLDVVDVLGDEDTSVGGGVLRRIPAGMAGAVASFAVLAMAFVTLRGPQQRDLRPATDIALATPDRGADGDASTSADSTGRIGLEWAAGTLSAAEIELLQEVREPAAVAPLLERRRRLLDRIAGGEPVVATVLAELDLLVEQLAREGVDVERLRRLEQDDAAAQEGAPESSSQAPPSGDSAPPAEPADEGGQEAAPDEPAADGEGEGEEPVIPFNDQPEGDEGGSPDGGGSDASGQDNGSKGEEGDGGLFGG